MTHLQKEFLSELQSKDKLTVIEYANLYDKHTKLAIAQEEKNGASSHQAKAMGSYYTISILSDFIDSENKLARIIAIYEKK